MPQVGKEIKAISEMFGLNPEHVENMFFRPETVPLEYRGPIREALNKSRFIKNEIAHAQSTKNLNIYALFGNFVPYLESIMRYGKESLMIPQAWETPRSMVKKYYCSTLFFFETDFDFEDMLEIEKNIIFINPKRTQNLFNEVRGPDLDEVMDVAIRLLPFNNNLHPYKVVLP